MANLFQPSLQRALDDNGNPISGAKLYFYTTGTTTLATVYSNQAGTTVSANPVIADSDGIYAPVYLDSTATYRVVEKSSDDATTHYDIDPVRGYDESGATDAQEAAEAAQAAAETAATNAQTAAGGTTGTAYAISETLRQFSPFQEVADVPIGDLVPTSTYPVVACRLHANWIVVRVRTADLDAGSIDDIYWDEYFLRDPAGASDVPGGWQLVGHRTFMNGKYSIWLVAPDEAGQVPNADFALRIGLYSSSYVSGGEGPDYAFTGFGHGRMNNTPANNQVIISGSPTASGNLQTVANWPVGTRHYGTSMSINQDFFLMLWDATYSANPFTTTNASTTVSVSHSSHGYTTGMNVKITADTDTGGITAAQLTGTFTITVTDANNYTFTAGGTATSSATGGGSSVTYSPEAVDLNYVASFGTQGMRRYGAYQALMANIGIQDSYGHMFPLNIYDFTHFKPANQTAIAIDHDTTQKGNWTTGTETIHQAYNSANNTIVCTVNLEYGSPLRKQGGGLAAWGQNIYGRYFFRDLTDFAKYYIFINSSEQSTPRTAWELPVGDVFEWQNTLSTRYLSGGPA